MKIYYFRDDNTTACLDGTEIPKSSSEVQGSLNKEVNIKYYGFYIFNRIEINRNIKEGNWQIHFDLRAESGGGPQNKVYVNVSQRDSVCNLKKTLVNEWINVDKGIIKEYSTIPVNRTQTDFVAGDHLRVVIGGVNGSQKLWLRYNGAGVEYDSRLETPDPKGETQTVTSIEAGDSKMIVYESSSEHTVNEITVTSQDTVENVSITVEKLDENPQIIVPPNEIYKYFEIQKTNITDENISAVEIKFQVEKSWINNKIISLYKYKESNWQKLPTSEINSDDVYCYFNSNGLCYQFRLSY